MKKKISIIGLGYVGLPLAMAFEKHYRVVGYDVLKERISQLKIGNDTNNEFKKNELVLSKNLKLTDDISDTKNSEIFIITVPTPIFKNNLPNLNYLKKACEKVGNNLKKGSIIIFESTVYPGCTEDFCVPLIEKISNKKYNKDFFVGYSPERINVGDKKHNLQNIKKIVSASNKKSLNIIVKMYSKIIIAGVHVCQNLKTAEAAKAIENAQRDINIAFINEVGNIFSKLDIKLNDVLQAARTKWNFLDFRPGLVGGHCIGVDPYYLTYCAKKVGLNPKVINAGRHTNDNMSKELSNMFFDKLINSFKKEKKLNILILGLSFKENTNDTRNSKVFDLARNLKKKGCNIDVYDPLIDNNLSSTNFKIVNMPKLKNKYHGIFFAVAHKKIIKDLNKIFKRIYKKSIIFDVKDTVASLKLKNNNIYRF
jgi:UDP-N-acetyl-D-galactosamine dehydrogenase